jgi:hypothetical protein
MVSPFSKRFGSGSSTADASSAKSESVFFLDIERASGFDIRVLASVRHPGRRRESRRNYGGQACNT